MVFAAGGAPPLVEALAVVLIGAAAVGYLCQRIGLIPIVGYLAVGAVAGPNALAIIDDPDLVDQAAEIGIIFLLFAIGLELSGEQLRRLGALLFGGGFVQVGLTVAAVALLALPLDVPLKVGIYTGCLVALSSTAIVLKLLSERGETGSPTGEVAISFLIFQDIAVVLLVLLVPFLGEGGGSASDIIVATVKSLGLIVVVLLVVRYVTPPILGAVSARTNNEEFLLVVLALAIGIGWAVTLLDLSASLGAFIAGLVVSSGPHRERATRYVEPFQILFSAIFFASTGMKLDLEFLVDEFGRILAFAAVIVVLKAVIVGFAARLFKRPWPVVVASALLLAQIGEFAFILEQTGRDNGLTPFDREDGTQLFIATAVLLFALTPALKTAGERWAARLGGTEPDGGREDAVVVVGDPARLEQLVEQVSEAAPELEVLAADASSMVPAPPSSAPSPVRLVVIDGASGAFPSYVVRRALAADPPIPLLVRVESELDAEPLRAIDGIEVFVDDTETRTAFAEAIAAAAQPSSGHGH